MNYEETLDYLFTRLPMFTRIGSAAFKKDLTNTIALCNALDNPQEKFRSVHVGGTNGKGSVSHMLAAIFQEAGYKTGLYTSPHLKDFRERIRINGEMVPQAFVVDFVRRIQPMIDQIEPSFFEITVAMAFDYFAAQQVDIAIIEVGLGGRLDSTNIIRPELSVITNIGWDHMNMLGNTLPEIAGEKAGIIKERTPVVIGETNPETGPVFTEAAAARQAPIYFADQLIQVQSYKQQSDHLSITVSNHSEGQTYQLDLTGLYQLKNLVTVLEGIHIMREKGWPISEDHLRSGLQYTKQLTGLHGRWEIIHHHPTVVLEVAHNKEGIEQMQLHLSTLTFDSLHIIMGMVSDKDSGKVLTLFPKEAEYYFTQAHIPRALPAEELQTQALSFDLTGEVWPDVNAALKAAIAKADPNDLIIVCGSIFLVAEVETELPASLNT